MSLLDERIEELPRGLIATQYQLQKLREFVNFATLVYSSWWLTCNSPVDAPWNDFYLYQRMLKYEILNPTVSESALKASSLSVICGT